MNEKIKQLVERAGFELHYNCGPLEGEGEIYYAKEFEKFAELIVKECANICGKDSLDYRYIKEHFGVE